MLVDEYLPIYDISDSVTVVVDADADATWEALMDADLIEVGRRRPMLGAITALRMLPDIVGHALHGEGMSPPPKPMTLHASAELPLGDGGWVLLGERPGEEIALGLVGKFWRPVIPFAKVGADAFKGFAEPGYAKTVYSLSIRALDGERTLLSGVMGPPPQTSTRGAGFVATGPSAWAPVPTCSSTGCSTSCARTPRSEPDRDSEDQREVRRRCSCG